MKYNKNDIIYMLILFCSYGCTKYNIIGHEYRSSCFLYSYPKVILYLNKDSTFSYKFAYLQDSIKGRLKISKDSLFLFSESFLQLDTGKESPIIKNTNTNEYDGYIIKKNKLVPLSSHKEEKNKCHLLKQISSSIR